MKRFRLEEDEHLPNKISKRELQSTKKIHKFKKNDEIDKKKKFRG